MRINEYTTQRNIKILRAILPSKVYDFIFPKHICGKTWIDSTMKAKYGEDWEDELWEAFKDREVCKSVAETLGLKKEYYETEVKPKYE